MKGQSSDSADPAEKRAPPLFGSRVEAVPEPRAPNTTNIASLRPSHGRVCHWRRERIPAASGSAKRRTGRRETILVGAATPAGGLVAVPGTEDAMASTQSEVSALFDSRSEAMRMKDIDRLMSLYSPDIVYFDVVPPLQYIGSAALRGRFSRWFDGWQGAIGQEIRDLNILASGDVAVACMLIRASGTLKNGREVGYWVRVTNCCRRSNHRWLITHEHVSLPVDFESGSAAMDLVP